MLRSIGERAERKSFHLRPFSFCLGAAPPLLALCIPESVQVVPVGPSVSPSSVDVFRIVHLTSSHPLSRIFFQAHSFWKEEGNPVLIQVGRGVRKTPWLLAASGAFTPSPRTGSSPAQHGHRHCPSVPRGFCCIREFSHHSRGVRCHHPSLTSRMVSISTRRAMDFRKGDCSLGNYPPSVKGSPYQTMTSL